MSASDSQFGLPGAAPGSAVAISFPSPPREDGPCDQMLHAALWMPVPAGSGHPLVIVSHGTGGNRFAYASLGRVLAAHGYVVIHPTHTGSDDAAMKSASGRRIDRIRSVNADPRIWRSRAADISLSIDAAASHPLLRGRADTTRIAVIGHSYGAHTAMTIGGMYVTPPGGPAESLRDPRVSAILALSPPSVGRMGIAEGAWNALAVPLLVMTGTLDAEPDVGDYSRRRMAFDQSRGDALYVQISGADHLTFADYAPIGNRMSPPDPQHVAWAYRTCVRFLDAYVRGDALSLEWLRRRCLEEESAGVCTVEFHATR